MQSVRLECDIERIPTNLLCLPSPHRQYTTQASLDPYVRSFSMCCIQYISKIITSWVFFLHFHHPMIYPPLSNTNSLFKWLNSHEEANNKAPACSAIHKLDKAVAQIFITHIELTDPGQWWAHLRPGYQAFPRPAEMCLHTLLRVPTTLTRWTAESSCPLTLLWRPIGHVCDLNIGSVIAKSTWLGFRITP